MYPHRIRDRKRTINLRNTYVLLMIFLVIGLLQLIIAIFYPVLEYYLFESFSISIFEFFVSCQATQYYVFFFHLIDKKSTFIRNTAAIVTYELNTIAMLKYNTSAPKITLIIALAATITVISSGALFGYLTKEQQRGPFMNRRSTISWSERIFVVTCLGITICSEMHRKNVVLILLSIYSAILTLFAFIFSASIHKLSFYKDCNHDYILIAQLLYLHYFGMFMCFAWNSEYLILRFNWNTPF